MRKLYFLLVTILFAGITSAQVNIAAGGSYSQDFDGLGTTAIASYTNNTTLAGWYITSAGLPVNTGTNNANSVYNFGNTGTNPNTDRALGAISTSTTHRFGLRLVNNGASAITALTISFTGEQWRSNNAGNLTFDYQIGTTVTSLSVGTWTAFSNLDFASLATSSGAAMDGNAPANRTAKSATLAVSIPAGSEIFLRWSRIGSSSPGLAIDDLTITAAGGNTAPSVSATAATSITTNSATLGGNVLADGGATLTARGVVYSTTNNNPEIGGAGVTVLAEGSTTTGAFTVPVSGLPNGTTIYFKAYATNSVGTSYSAVSSFSTLKPEPTNHATAFTAGTATASSIPLTWVDATGGTIPDGYLIKWSATSLASIVDPVDGTAETNGAGVLNVAQGVQSATITGLLSSTQYFFKIYPYTNTGSSINYKVDGAEPHTQRSTIAGPWEQFETGSKGSYGIANVTLTSGSWSFDDALIGSLSGDKKNGERSARIINTGNITMNFNLTSGVGAVTVNHASYGSDAASTWRLEASADDGATWTAYTSDDVTTTATLSPVTFTLNRSGAVRLRIVKLTGGSNRLNIDDISFTTFVEGPLPVRFTAIKATRQNNGVKVEWTNSTETDVVSYTIERSTDGRSYLSLASVAPRSNNGGRNDYQYLDAAPAAEGFYRIRAVEIDGKVTYSSVVRISTGRNAAVTLTVYPNPVRGTDATLQLSNLPAGNYAIRVIGSNGQPLSTRSFTHAGGSVNETLPALRTAGLYRVQVSGPVQLQSTLIVQ
jgi:hypothetical protein